MNYRPDIDGLRAIAVLSVILFHYEVPWLRGGFVGVDIFFVISGFLITSIINREVAEGRFSFAAFYQRRFRRIFPVLWVVLLATLGASYMLLSQERVALAWSTVWAVASLSNVFFWRTLGYFDGGADETPLLHTWSLSVEEQYYIAFPCMVLLVARYARNRLPWVLMIAIAASLAASVWLTEHKPSAAFYLPLSRAYELGLGALAATVPLTLKRGLGTLACMGGLVLCIASVILFDPHLPFPGALALIPCAGAAFLVQFGRQGNAVTSVLGCGPLSFIGKISYSLYLWHWPILVFYKYSTMRSPSALETVALLALTALLATASYAIVETPFRRHGHRTTPVQDLRLALVMASSVLAAAAVLIAFKGFPDPKLSAAMATIEADMGVQKNSACFFGLEQGGEAIPALEQCRLRDPAGTPVRRILLWGDSYANHYVDAIRGSEKLAAVQVTYLTHSSCPPFLTYFDKKCDDFNQAVLRRIATGQFDTVILAGNWWTYSRDTAFAAQLTKVTEKLSSRGMDVYVIGASPVYHSRVPHIAFRNERSGKTATDEYRIEFGAALDTAMQNAVSPQARYFSPYRVLCHEDTCRFRERGQLLHIDQGHFSRRGAELVLAALLSSHPELSQAQP